MEHVFLLWHTHFDESLDGGERFIFHYFKFLDHPQKSVFRNSCP